MHINGGDRLFDYIFRLGDIRQFYGTDNRCFKLDDLVFEAMEDESDGYRSYFDTIQVKDSTGLIFFQTPIDTVCIEYIDDGNVQDSEQNEVNMLRSFNGYLFRSTIDGHLWLAIGTSYTDSYYPYFIFKYQPRSPKHWASNY